MGIDILVPVLGRPQNAQPLVNSIEAACEQPHRIIFICSPSDSAQIAACRATGQDTLVVEWPPGRADYAKKINYGYEHSDSEWVFQGADDLRFGHAWDSFALGLARTTGKRVIGTNDLHNPAVRRRQHATHILFARSYIEEYGGTLDGSGKVLSEVYDHQFVDTEFIVVARRRQTWVFCRESVVEHLHPHWGLAEMDDTYRKSYRQMGQDQRLFMQRMGKIRVSARNQRFIDRQEARRLLKEQRSRR